MKKTLIGMVSAVVVCSLPRLSPAASITVNVVPDFAAPAHSVAIAPLRCIEGLDCLLIERKLAQLLSAYHFAKVASADDVRGALFALELSELSEQTKTAVAEKLGVGAFLVPLINSAGTLDAGSVAVWSGYSIISVPNTSSVGNVELALVSTNDGKVLMRGIAAGESSWRSAASVVIKLYAGILKRAFGVRK